MDILDKITSPRLRKMVVLCRDEVPGFTIKFKNRSLWMKFLGLFAMLFNNRFMSSFTTTTGRTVYIATEELFLAHQDSYAQTLAHELEHLIERQKEGTFYNALRYLFPQILVVFALLAVLAIWNLWFLLALVFLLALLPLPAPGRRDIELRGYTMSMATRYWLTGSIRDRDFERIASQFTSSAYYFMWPWHDDIVHRLKLRAQNIRTGVALQDPTYRKVHAIFTAKDPE